MKELLEFSFTGVNLIPTILMIFTFLYWAIVLVGVVDVDTLDLDLDVDADADVDIDPEVEIGGGGMASVLTFFNLGHMPLMVFVTFFVIPFWAITVLFNDLLGVDSFAPGLVVLIPTMVGCLFIAKFFTIPIAKFYRKIRTETEAVEQIVGQIVLAKLPISQDKSGQAEIKVGGTSVLITARTRSGHQEIPKGGQALVIDYDETGRFYFVEPYF